ncbi:MAG: YfhO family protein [Bacilli bacterium]|nr:YfhO family protein [Bacilli bacterium]MDY6430244.1 YfhO family protein [Bacilli bacterium]
MTLSERRKKIFNKENFKRGFSFLLDWRSDFYFMIFVAVIAFVFYGWMLLENDFTHMTNWDYAHQFIPLYYHDYDIWKSFFTTGHFNLYDYDIYMGLDNIGANSFYSLFDPFVIIMVIFPREAVPHLTAVSTMAKLVIAAQIMNKYLQYMGLKRSTSRIGALCYSFCGWMVFMSGFPSYITVVTFMPLILLGIERVIKQKKPICLIFAVFLMGISNFFFLVCACIWGVIYAVWRFFTSIKKRNEGLKKNIEIMFLGVVGFGIGIALCSFTLLPSIRNSSLSGRTTSVGSIYFDYIKTSLKSHDLKTFFFLIFEEVGDNPGRELMSFASFFFPSEGFQYLPTVVPDMTANGRYVYDAWTSSLFVYTPCIIGVFIAALNSIRLKKFHHLFGILGIFFLLTTNFSYYFFYAFSGNGYGRWYIVIIPVIIYYACWGLDQKDEEPRWLPIAGGVLALFATLIVYIVTTMLLKGKRFTNPYNQTYFKVQYTFEASQMVMDPKYFLFSQIGFIVGYSIIYGFFMRKKICHYLVFILVTAEVIVVGVNTNKYQSLWKYRSTFMGGETNLTTSLTMQNAINGGDYTHFKTYTDLGGSSKVFGHSSNLNNTMTFHSLMNFMVDDFAMANRMKGYHTIKTTYNDKKYDNASWSGYYSHKRFFVDRLLNYKYYVIKNALYSTTSNRKDVENWVPANYPFFADEVENYSVDRDQYRIYKVKDNYSILGHAVDSSLLYRLGKDEENPNYNAFITTISSNKDIDITPYLQFQRFQAIQNFGAIFDDNVAVPSDFVVQDEPLAVKTISDLQTKLGFPTFYNSSNYKITDYITGKNTSDRLFPASKDGKSIYKETGVNYFFNKDNCVQVGNSGGTNIKSGYSHLVYTPVGKSTFNKDGACYIEFSLQDGISKMPTIMLFDADNNLLALEKSMMTNAYNCSSSYGNGVGGTFGIYAKGNVAKIVLYYDYDGANPTYRANQNKFIFFVYDGSQIENYLNKWVDDGLKDVFYGADSYSFKTNYEKPRIVVTQLGYDAGWKISAVDKDGNAKPCNVYRLNGGLVGFNAPSGEVTYRLYYETPFLKIGKIGFVLGAVCVVIFAVAPVAMRYHRKKKRKV